MPNILSQKVIELGSMCTNQNFGCCLFIFIKFSCSACNSEEILMHREKFVTLDDKFLQF